MKCPNCGNKVKGKVCKYCNSELPYDENALARDNFLLNFLYIINRILCPPAKAMFVFWTFNWVLIFSQDPDYPFFPKIAIIVFGYLIFCGISSALYYSDIKRGNAYKIKILNKKLDRLSKTMDKYFPYKKLLDEAEHLTDVVNTTIDENTFETSYNRLIDISRELQKYEHFGTFTISPTEYLNNLYSQREATTESFYQRRDTAMKQANDSITSYISTQSKLNFDNMDGHDFEYFCADILKKNGFSNVEVTQGSGDHGIDILANKDDISYAIQCKCYSGSISNSAVQQAHTGKALYKCDIAVVLTNRYFTPQALEEANALGVKLWNRDKLMQLIDNIAHDLD